MQTMIDHMARHDARLEDLEDSHKAMLAHFVKQRQEAKTKFPLRTVEEVYEFAEAGDFDNLIVL